MESPVKSEQLEDRTPPTNDVIRFSDLERKTLLLKDESGDEVYEVVDRLTGRIYALKEFSSPFDSSLRAQISLEFHNLEKLNHPNLVKCYQLFEIDGRISFLLERLDGGSLDGASITNLNSLASVAYHVLLGLNYLHENKIWHGEVKPSNIFVDSEKQAKVLYLGKFMSKTFELSGTGAIHDAFSWDVWNLGLTILKLFSFSSSPADREPSEDMCRFLDCCMTTDLSQRWTAGELLRHPFLFGIDLLKTSGGGEASFLALSSKSPIGEEQISSKKKNDKILTTRGAELSLSLSVQSESTITYGEEEISPKKKKHKPSVAVEDSSDILDGSKASTEKRYLGTLNYLERCIQHCSLFLPDCEFERDKLIRMWIAEECIEVEGIERAEDVAGQCFDVLVDKKLILPMRFHHAYNDWIYKVDASQIPTLVLTKGDYLTVDDGHQLGEISGEALHLLCKCKALGRTLLHALQNFKHLRTLRVVKDQGFPPEQLPSGIFLGLKELRTLDLSHGDIFELPGSLGTMESLRYLDVSYTPIKELPESTVRLSHLQTLNLRDCSRLNVLPRKFSNLKSLCHLDLDVVGQLRSMPKGMGNLTKLQTLKAFLVGKNDGFRIEELGNMNEITGSFCIKGLENISSAEEAKKASLADKSRIDGLELIWNEHTSDPSIDTTEILECLQPHFSLRELTVICFGGSKFPTWIINPSFTNLSSITLIKCTGCHLLPSLGELPSLKTLHIIQMDNVRDISSLFHRSGSKQKSAAFPKLEKLELEHMQNLEEWSGTENADLASLRQICIAYCPKLTVVPSLSHLYTLQHLEFRSCMKLAALPEGLLPDSVECLIIKDCPMVKEWCLKNEGQDWLKVASIKEIWIDFDQLSLD